jgi:hypothetical protein
MIAVSGAITSGGVRLGFGTPLTLSEDDAAAIRREVPDVLVAVPGVSFVACSARWMGVNDLRWRHGQRVRPPGDDGCSVMHSRQRQEPPRYGRRAHAMTTEKSWAQSSLNMGQHSMFELSDCQERPEVDVSADDAVKEFCANSHIHMMPVPNIPIRITVYQDGVREDQALEVWLMSKDTKPINDAIEPPQSSIYLPPAAKSRGCQ